MEKISSLYADFILDTHFADLEGRVVQQVKLLLMDLIGVSLAGYQSMEFPRMVVEFMDTLGGAPEATIFQTKNKVPGIHAAFANAACAHGIDMDDGHRFSGLHPGTVVIPAAMAAAERSGSSTKQLIAGIVAGYEIMIRIGMTINPSSLNRGFHLTGLSGPFGAVAAAGKIMGLDRKALIGAFGLAGLQVSGLGQVTQDAQGAGVKPLNPAKAAMSGLMSSIMAEKGAQGPGAIFEGNLGFLKAVADEVNPDRLTRGLGREYEICNVYIKRWAGCRHTHAAIDAALMALASAPVGVDKISGIAVETYPVALKIAGIRQATNASAGRFSIPFSVALALMTQDAGADQYTEENINDTEIQNLAAKITLSISDEWEKPYPQKRGATVTLTGEDQRRWSAKVTLAKGEPENPVSREEVHAKFKKNATMILSAQNAEKIVNVVENFEDVSLSALTGLI